MHARNVLYTSNRGIVNNVKIKVIQFIKCIENLGYIPT